MDKLRSLFRGKRSFPKRLLLAALPSLAVCFTLFFFGPLDLTYVSRNFVNYSALEILPYVSLLTAAAFVILLLLASIPGGKVHAFLVSVYAGIAAALYIQGAFLNPDFGTLDGHTINWPSFSTMMLVNLIIWFLILLLPHLIHYFSNRTWRLFVMILSGAIIIMQGASLAVKMIDQHRIDRQAGASYVMLTDNMLNLANQKNTIVFLLDNTSNAYLDQVEEKYPGIMDQLSDFTRFDNANSHYLKTVPSLVNMLTGEEWDCENEYYRDYFRRAWSSPKATGFYNTLHENHFDVNIYAFAVEIVSNLSDLAGIADNIRPYDQQKYLLTRSFLNLIKLSVYRYAPLSIKPFFLIYTADILTMFSADNTFHNQWDLVTKFNKDRLHYSDSENAFNFYYLQGRHSPFYLTENGEYFEDHSVKTSGPEQLAGFINLIGRYLEQLKEMGLYNSAEIIILADHGNSPNLNSDDATNNFANSDFQPMLMIKRPGEQHDAYVRNHAPVTIQEMFYPTILQGMEIDHQDYGTSAFDIPEDAAIERWTRFYAEDENYEEYGSRKVDILREYRYTGDGRALIEQCLEGNYKIFPMIDSYY